MNIMQMLAFARKLDEFDLPVFTFNDIIRIINKNPAYTKVFLARAQDKGILQKIEKGKYTRPGTAIELIASNLLIPSYISLLSALYFHGLTTQIPHEIQVIGLRQKNYLHFAQYTIRFVRFQKKRFFGFTRNDGAFLAWPEKAIIDGLYLGESLTISEIVEILKTKELDIHRLLRAARLMSSYATVKRLGYILETLGFAEAKSLHKNISKSLDIFNPLLPVQGSKNSKWNLLINEEVL